MDSSNKKAGYSYWLTQDKVPAKVIRGFTKSCERDDCCVSFRAHETTCMSVADWYTKDGTHIIVDSNRFTGAVCCRKCWRSGIVDNNGDMLEEHGPREV